MNTKETYTEITEEMLERLTTENVTATKIDTGLVQLKHKNHPFTISLALHRLQPNVGTVELTLSNESIFEIKVLEGLTLAESKTALRNAVHKGEAPRKVNMATANGSRLEKVYSEWFLYVNTYYVSYMARCIDIKQQKAKQTEKAETILAKTKATRKSTCVSDAKIVLHNACCEYEIYTTSSTTQVRGIRTHGFSDAQKTELFLLLDRFSNENK